ncbi:MAG: NAD(P)H-dependent oxidoreductase [bacterium]|nr:NAD(P)H-dependent oxidoreductase [bacterium]
MKTVIVRECGPENPDCDYLLDLTKTEVKDCIGCWTCWLKKPGSCAHKDLDDFYRAFLSADKLIIFSKANQGFVSGNMKSLFDRMIPLYLPYINYKKGESMHFPRYEKYPDIEVYYEGSFDTDEEKDIYEAYLNRLLYQFLCEHYVIKPISEYTAAPATAGNASKSASKGLIIMNGSPNAARGNTEVFIRKFIEGMQEDQENQNVCGVNEVAYAAKEDHEALAEKLQEHDEIIISFPLYVHAMPGSVKKVLECMKPVEGSGKRMGFIIQYGFMEGAQSDYVVRYLKSFTKKMNYELIGIAVHGGSAGVSMMPEKMNKKLFTDLKELGSGYSRDGSFSKEVVAELRKPEHLTKGQCHMYDFMGKLGLTDGMFWNMQLKKNNAFDHRYDRPYIG